MRIKKLLPNILQSLANGLANLARRCQVSPPPPEQLPLNLDQLTASGLPLREALPVRSAEFWLQLGGT